MFFGSLSLDYSFNYFLKNGRSGRRPTFLQEAKNSGNNARSENVQVRTYKEKMVPLVFIIMALKDTEPVNC